MGQCKDCKYYSNTTAGVFDRHYCLKFTHFTGTDDDIYYRKKYFYVRKSGMCDNFEVKITPQNSNYKKNCFLTSAMVDYYGKADDCGELTALRAFRDGYMRTAEGGEELIKEYYEMAPKIVERINSSGKKDKYYKYISEVVEKCVKLIALKENERALTEYKFMVENLKKEFDL